ncbi:MAG: hypothetical protein ACHQ1G_05810 [Planctomycetota bacterium]
MTTTKMRSARFTVTVEEQRLRDLLCSAVEGGSNYWASFSDDERTDKLDYISVRVKVTEEPVKCKAGIVRTKLVRASDLIRGLERMAADSPGMRQHLGDFLAENDDADTADVVLQMTLFGEVVFG